MMATNDTTIQEQQSIYELRENYEFLGERCGLTRLKKESYEFE